MAYSDFTLPKVKQMFGLSLDEARNLFQTVSAVQPSTLLQQALDENFLLATAINSEKARSEKDLPELLVDLAGGLLHCV